MQLVESVPDVSILMCTYNRASVMKDALLSWLQVDQAEWDVEFIVVDNASTDGTCSAVSEVAQAHSYDFRYVYEPTSGLSHARNRGIDEARAEIVAFVDDDVYFDAQWLNQLMQAFAENPEFDCVGGNTFPAFEIPRPEWLDDTMVKFYGATLSGSEDREMNYPEHPFGVNMAFRRRVFESIGKFNPNLGRIGYSLLSNEESEFFYRAAAAKLRIYYAAGAVLHHRIPTERLDPEWLVRRSYWQGISKVVFDTQVEQVSRSTHLLSFFGACKRYLSLYRRSLLGLTTQRSPREKLQTRLRYHQLLGVAKQSVVEALRMSA